MSASARGSVLWQTMTLGTSVFGSESRGRGILSSRPPVEESRCHPVPIDSTGGGGSAVLFLGRSHPRLLPRSICMTPARQRQIWLCFPDGISSDITFGIPRSSQAGRFFPFFLLLLPLFVLLLLLFGARRVHSRSVERLPSAPCTLMERGPLLTS